MKKIIRQQLDITNGSQTFAAGIGPLKLIHCAESRDEFGKIDAWFEIGEHDRFRKVDFEGYSEVEISLYVAGTGETIPDSYAHEATVVMKSDYVWHIYRTN